MHDTTRLQVLYDGNCPICRNAVNRFKHRDRRSQLQLIDINDPAFDPTQFGLSQADVMARMHTVHPDGSVHSAMDAIHTIHRAIGLGWLTAPTRLPLLRPLFDRLYELVARYRPRYNCTNHCRIGDHSR